jgi:hypothetical protein
MIGLGGLDQSAHSANQAAVVKSALNSAKAGTAISDAFARALAARQSRGGAS